MMTNPHWRIGEFVMAQVSGPTLCADGWYGARRAAEVMADWYAGWGNDVVGLVRCDGAGGWAVVYVCEELIADWHAALGRTVRRGLVSGRLHLELENMGAVA
jgi:hypothetical protein